jgi:ArsR family transcriptional regulator
VKAISCLLSAIADPTRLRLLRLLQRQELCVCELMAAVELPQYQVSRHLRELRLAGLVEASRSGRWMHYRVSRFGATDAFCQDLLKVLDVHTRELPYAKRDDARLSAQLARGRADRYRCA